MGLFNLFGKKTSKKSTGRKSTSKSSKSKSSKPKSSKAKTTSKKTTSNKKAPTTKSKGRNKRKAKNEFRYNNSTSHPNYIFEESGKKYRAVGLTHSDKTFGKQNMPLKSNPRKTDPKPAYIRNGIISEKKSNFSKKPIKGMSFGKEDFPNVKAKIRNYKKNRRK